MRQKDIPGKNNFVMARVDCTSDEGDCVALILLDWCASMRVDGYPSVFLYKSGNLVREYDGELKAKSLWLFILKQLQKGLDQDSEGKEEL